jgi:hypothetical protein
MILKYVAHESSQAYPTMQDMNGTKAKIFSDTQYETLNALVTNQLH